MGIKRGIEAAVEAVVAEIAKQARPVDTVAVHAWLDTVLDGPVAAEMTSLVTRLDEHARSDALGQKLLSLTVPGVPDVYQGTELWENSLVDPDNRRPVDYRVRRESLSTLNRTASSTASTVRCWRRGRPPRIWWRFVAAATCWPRSPGTPLR